MTRSGVPAPGIPSDWSDLTDYIDTLKAGRSSHSERWHAASTGLNREIHHNFCVERMFTRFPAHRSAKEGTEDLPCELGARKKCFCNPADRLRSCLITKWQ